MIPSEPAAPATERCPVQETLAKPRVLARDEATMTADTILGRDYL